MLESPSAYVEGYRKARRHNHALADSYIRHTTIGDPALDSVMEEISSLPPHHLHRFIKAGIDQEKETLRAAPESLREFFENLEDPPWFDYEAFRPGVRAFHLNTTKILVAFVTGVLIEGFATMIAKSFATTGRVLSPLTARRRLMQNNRHLLEVFFPGGLRRDGDGWKLSMRLRFVHARVRHLLANSDAWDTDAWGTPISAAHLGFRHHRLFHAPAETLGMPWEPSFPRKKKRVCFMSGDMPVTSWACPRASSLPMKSTRGTSSMWPTCASRLRTVIRPPWPTRSWRRSP